MNEDKLIFQGYVLNNQDPLMLGRIRALPIDEIESDVLPSDWNEEKDIWTERDPLIYLPLLPYYISQVPREDEYIHIFYYNKRQVVDNTKFYIQGPITRPQNNLYENWHNSEAMLASGVFLKQANQIKDPISLEIKGQAKGIYPEPGDNALLGRGTADVIVKQNEVLIRAGKNVPTQTANFNLPTPRLNRGFLQISNFDLERTEKDPIKKTVFSNKPQLVKKLVEWEVTDQINITGFTSGGGITGDTFYNGNIKLYSLLPKDQTKTTEIFMDTPLDQYKSGPEYTLSFTGQTLENGIKIVNQFINGVNDGKINIQGYEQFPFENDTKLTSQFPFYFRPTKNNSELLDSGDLALVNSEQNLLKFFDKIKLSPANKVGGYSLIWEQNVVGQQPTFKKETVDGSIYNQTPVTYGAMGGDYLYFLSHKSDAIPSKTKIDLQGTLYGIDQNKFTKELVNQTDAMVRGDQLMSLINLIVKFLVSHVHAFPGLPPVPVGTDGTNTEDILQKILNANTTILNQNIRIN